MHDRGDAWAEQVRLRLSDTRCSHDLLSADGRYHVDCRKKFTNVRNIKASPLPQSEHISGK